MRCDDARPQLSARHDDALFVGGRDFGDDGLDVDYDGLDAHVDGCVDCQAFVADLEALDRLLARGAVDHAPDVAAAVMEEVGRPSGVRWWPAAAVALVGLVIGALVSGVGARLTSVSASDLPSLYDMASAQLTSLSADLVVVERGWHPLVTERTYRGSIDYAAPESLDLSLVDLTTYPGTEWPANDVDVVVADGLVARTGTAACRVEAMPGCLGVTVGQVLGGVKPFDEGSLRPLELIAPTDTLAFGEGHAVLGETTLGDRPVIQVQTTVAAASTIDAILHTGNWRELHPSDPALVWFDAEYLVPLRTEVFAADDPDRELWAIRRGYKDPIDEPILIVEVANLRVNQDASIGEVGPAERLAGFVDGPAEAPALVADGFEPHRQGFWLLPGGERVDTASWSDGRNWLVVESTREWTEERLFGMPGPTATVLMHQSAGRLYVDPVGGRVAIHAVDRDVVLNGSVPTSQLVELAASLGVVGEAIPPTWRNGSLATPSADYLVPTGDGWSIPAIRQDGETIRIVVVGAGTRSIVIEQSPGAALEPAAGPDVTVTAVRGIDGRYSSRSGTLEWLEDGRRIVMRSDTVGRAELIDVAERMAES